MIRPVAGHGDHTAARIEEGNSILGLQSQQFDVSSQKSQTLVSTNPNHVRNEAKVQNGLASCHLTHWTCYERLIVKVHKMLCMLTVKEKGKDTFC